MKEISKAQVELLTKRKFIKNTNVGFVNKKGDKIGFYKTRHKRYAEDRYVNLAVKLVEEAKNPSKYNKYIPRKTAQRG